MTSHYRYQITAPHTPGAQPTELSYHHTLREARIAARTYSDRRDLTYQDVRIERVTNGCGARLHEYAGPAR